MNETPSRAIDVPFWEDRERELIVVPRGIEEVAGLSRENLIIRR